MHIHKISSHLFKKSDFDPLARACVQLFVSKNRCEYFIWCTYKIKYGLQFVCFSIESEKINILKKKDDSLGVCDQFFRFKCSK